MRLTLSDDLALGVYNALSPTVDFDTRTIRTKFLDDSLGFVYLIEKRLIVIFLLKWKPNWLAMAREPRTQMPFWQIWGTRGSFLGR